MKTCGHRGHGSAWINLVDPVAVGVGHVDVSTGIHRHTSRVVAAVQRRDLTLRRDLPNRPVVVVRHVDVTAGIHRDAVRVLKFCCSSMPIHIPLGGTSQRAHHRIRQRRLHLGNHRHRWRDFIDHQTCGGGCHAFSVAFAIRVTGGHGEGFPDVVLRQRVSRVGLARDRRTVASPLVTNDRIPTRNFKVIKIGGFIPPS